MDGQLKEPDPPVVSPVETEAKAVQVIGEALETLDVTTRARVLHSAMGRVNQLARQQGVKIRSDELRGVVS